MKCTACGWQNSEGVIYCDGCGSVLDSTKEQVVPGRTVQEGEDVEFNEAQEGRVQIRLTVLRGQSKGKQFTLEQGSNLVGRWDPEAAAFPEVDLESEDIEAKISRKHAVIEVDGRQITIQDIGSLNGTFINRGPRLEEGLVSQLKHGDEIIVGKTFLLLEVLES